MTLVKTKNKTTTNERKMIAAHHRKSQKYLKPYWPYLPIIVILGGAVVANDYLPASFNSGVMGNAGNARIDSVVGGHNSLLIGALTVALVVMVAWFALRHLRIVKKLVFEGEKLVRRNFMLDVVAALAIAGLYVMLR